MSVTGAGVVVEAVKLAEDRSGDVVVRLYESLGARTRARVTAGFEASGVVATDLLERPLDDGPALDVTAGGAGSGGAAAANLSGSDGPASAPSAPSAPSALSALSAAFELRPFQIVTLRFARP